MYLDIQTTLCNYKKPKRLVIWNRENTKEACIPDANDDFEVVLQGPLDVLLEIELSVGRQMILQTRKHHHVKE